MFPPVSHWICPTINSQMVAPLVPETTFSFYPLRPNIWPFYFCFFLKFGFQLSYMWYAPFIDSDYLFLLFFLFFICNNFSFNCRCNGFLGIFVTYKSFFEHRIKLALLIHSVICRFPEALDALPDFAVIFKYGLLCNNIKLTLVFRK